VVSIAFFEEVIEPLGPVRIDCIQKMRQAKIITIVLVKSHQPAEESKRRWLDNVDLVIEYGTNSKRYALAALRSYLYYMYDSGPLQMVVSNDCDIESNYGFVCVESKNFTCFGDPIEMLR
jgi:hypothetical protein